MVLSKIPFVELLNKNKRVYVLLKYRGVDVILVSAHLCSRDYNKHIRTKELYKINSNLKTLPSSIGGDENIRQSVKNALRNHNVILLGDLNLHCPSENKILMENGFNDLWLELYSHRDGYTWDPARNTMINIMLPFDNRRMRLDRIWLKDSKQLDLEDISIFADSKLGCWYLYPSDHFGLKARIVLNWNGLTLRDNSYKKEVLKLAHILHFRSINRIVVYRVTWLVLLVIIVLAIFIWLIVIPVKMM